MRATPAHRRTPGVIQRVFRRFVRVVSRLALLAWLTGTALALFATAAYADDDEPTPPVDSIAAVVTNIRVWLLGILVAVATLFLTIGGLRLMWANGDPGEAEKGKSALKSAAIGYMLALLAPLIVTIVGRWVA
ncbi:pilin [Luedemannella flava]